jgi:hypothetical protein
MDDFNTIRLKKKTIEKFKRYSRKVSPTYSDTLDFMIAFFRDNDISPYDTLDNKMPTIATVLNKRMDAVVSILRNMEKMQLIPARKKLESLFQGVAKEEEKKLILEKEIFEPQELITENEELDYYRNQYYNAKENFNSLKHEFEDVMNQSDFIKNTFGKSYYKLNLTQQEFEEIKSRLKENSCSDVFCIKPKS